MKIGIVGGGTIVIEFLTVAEDIEQISVTAIFARKEQVRNSLADRFHIPNVCGSYDELLKLQDVDVIYVAVTNYLHFEFAKKALLAGKNVIVEKPFTVSLRQAEELRDLADKKHLYLFEAISNFYNPNLSRIRMAVTKIGEIKLVEVRYSQYSKRYDQFKLGIILPVFDSTKAGGALMDLAVYNIHILNYLFGKPKEVHYFPNIESKIDTSGIMVLEYSNFSAISMAAKDCEAPCGILIQGTQGYIISHSKPNELNDIEIVLYNGERDFYCIDKERSRLFFEWISFAEMYHKGEYMEMSSGLQQTLDVMEILERGIQTSGLSFLS